MLNSTRPEAWFRFESPVGGSFATKTTIFEFRFRSVLTSAFMFSNRVAIGTWWSTSFVPIRTSAISGLYPESQDESFPPEPTPFTIPPIVYPPCPSFALSKVTGKLGAVEEPTKSTAYPFERSLSQSQ